MKFINAGFAYINPERVTAFFFKRSRNVDDEVVYDIMADNIKIDEADSLLEARQKLRDFVDEINALVANDVLYEDI